MGGSAFTSGDSPLFTPRMSSSVYHAVRDHCQDLCRQYYSYVGTPLEAPGKTDYGDVDILVACSTPLADEHKDRIDLIAKMLGAVRVQRGQTSSFAIPWPSEPSSGVLCSSHQPERFIQVDVNVHNSKQTWEFEMFHHAHGDMFNILGTMIRKYGITVNNRGMHLRIEEIELIDWKKSMIFLTDVPREILNFLGLDEVRWHQQFRCVKDMFDYAASCRFFGTQHTNDDLADGGKKKLKSRDRRRLKQRPVFRQWVEDFIPQNGDQRNGKGLPTREHIKDEVFRRYGVELEYRERLHAWRLQRQRDQIWREIIKASVPTEDVDPQFRAASLRALKSVIVDLDSSADIAPPEHLKQEDGLFDLEATSTFIKNNWRRLGEIEIAQQKSRDSQALRHKNDHRRT